MVFILTRTLSVTEYGIYSILSTTISVLSTILFLSLNTYIITKLSGFNNQKRIKAFISIISFETLFLLISLIVLAIPVIRDKLLAYLKLEGYIFEFHLVLIIIFVNALFPLFSAYLNAKRKIEFQGFFSFLNKCMWIFFLLIFFIIFKKIRLSIIFILFLAGSAISLLMIIGYLKKDILIFFKRIKKISIPLIKNSLVFSLPTVAAGISSWVITAADRYMINYYQNSAAVGLYTLSYSLVAIMLSFSGIITQVLFPYISKAWHEKKNHNILFNAMLKYNLLIILPATVGLFILRKQIITLISGPEYLSGSSVIIILLFFPLLITISSIYMTHLLLQGRTKMVGLIYSLSAILNIVLNMVLIPSYGINGASFASLVSYIFMFALSYFISHKQIQWNFEFIRLKSIVFASVVMGLIIALINPQIYLTKIVTIGFGFVLYIALLFVSKVFVDKEYVIMHSFLPRPIQKIFKRFIYTSGGK